jgi:hypothetical protein
MSIEAWIFAGLAVVLAVCVYALVAENDRLREDLREAINGQREADKELAELKRAVDVSMGGRR